MSDELTQQERADQAHEDAVIGHEFNGKPLLPFSRSRQVAAQCMGMKAPGWNQEDIDSIRAGRFYKGILADTIILMWICSTKNVSELDKDDIRSSAWTVQRARNNPEAAYEAAEAWAERNGITGINSEGFGKAATTLMSILTGIAESEFRVDVEGGGSGDEPGKV